MTYHKTSELIAQGVAAGLANSEKLALAAKHLYEKGVHAPALSLAVLSLEEIGKVFLINGLIFAKPGDDRSRSFEKGKFRHKAKLNVLDGFPWMVMQFITVHPDFQQSGPLHQTVAIMLKRCQTHANAMFDFLGEGTFSDLDRWKQDGFYVNYTNESGFEVPADVVSSEFSGSVVDFARTLSDLLNFLLKGNLEKHKTLISGLRDKLSESDLKKIRDDADSLVKHVYGWTTEDDEEYIAD